MPLTKQDKSWIVLKINAQRARQYMGYNPKGALGKEGSDPRWVKQWNLHHPDYYEEFSYLLTSINWWSSQKEKTTHRTYKQVERVS